MNPVDLQLKFEEAPVLFWAKNNNEIIAWVFNSSRISIWQWSAQRASHRLAIRDIPIFFQWLHRCWFCSWSASTVTLSVGRSKTCKRGWYSQKQGAARSANRSPICWWSSSRNCDIDDHRSAAYRNRIYHINELSGRTSHLPLTTSLLFTGIWSATTIWACLPEVTQRIRAVEL